MKIGVVSSLGGRRDSGAIAGLAELLKNSDAKIARAAALALGAIGTADAATALQEATKAKTGDASAIGDALLHCAELLLAGQKVPEASSIYKALNGPEQPRLIRLAATRGLLACASKQT